VQGSEAAGRLGLVFKIAALAVAATIAGPTYSASVEEREVERIAARSGGPVAERQAAALDSAVRARWVEGEASERGLSLTEQELDAAFEEGVMDSFDNRKQFERFLKKEGLTEAEVRQQLRVDQLSAAIRAQVAEPAARAVTLDQVKAYVDANPQVLPAERTVWVAPAKNRARAIRLQQRLRRGATWAASGGHKTSVPMAVGDDTSALTRAIFRAKVDTVARYGRTVFKVTRDTPERPMPRKQQEAIAWELLSSEAQRLAIDAFVAQFTEKWRARTACGPAFAGHPSCGQPPTG